MLTTPHVLPRSPDRRSGDHLASHREDLLTEQEDEQTDECDHRRRRRSGHTVLSAPVMAEANAVLGERGDHSNAGGPPPAPARRLLRKNGLPRQASSDVESAMVDAGRT
jgi:hypothetical protein